MSEYIKQITRYIDEQVECGAMSPKAGSEIEAALYGQSEVLINQLCQLTWTSGEV